MEMESAFLQILANRIDEANTAVMKALYLNNTARNMYKDGKYDRVEPELRKANAQLLIAATTLHVIKDFVPHLTLKGNAEADA